MIEGAARDPAVPLALPAPAAAAGGGEPDFATVLMRAMVRDAVPDPAPIEPVDHAIRFDARGVLDMAAVEAAAARPVVTARSASGDSADRPVAGAVLRAGEVSLPARTHLLPVADPADPVPVLAPPKTVPAPDTGLVAPPVTGDAVAEGPVTADDITAPLARPRPHRSRTALARSAPQVAVAALADGLAVVAAVGALSDAERHRLRDAIAATLARHGHAPRAVTLLAMQAPSRFVEP